LVVVASASAAGYAILGFAAGFWPILAVLAMASAAFTSVFPLADAYALKGLAMRGRSYGSVRLWGSGAFIVGSLGAGTLAEILRPAHLIWLMVGALLVMALTAVGPAIFRRLYSGARSGALATDDLSHKRRAARVRTKCWITTRQPVPATMRRHA